MWAKSMKGQTPHPLFLIKKDILVERSEIYQHMTSIGVKTYSTSNLVILIIKIAIEVLLKSTIVFCNKALLKYNCIRFRRWNIGSNYCFIGLQERRNMSEETTTTTTSEDVDDNAEGKYFSSRQGFRKTIANPGKGVHNIASVSGTIDSPISIQNSSSTSRKKDHHHHHHHHHHHG